MALPKRTTLAMALLLVSPLAMASQAETAAQALARMQTDAQVLQNIANTWPQIQTQAQNYGQFSGYADREWAGEGPIVETELGGEELCHNTRWDSDTSNLVTGGLNIAGDAEAEAYAMEFVSEDFLSQLGDYLDATAQQVQAPNLAQVQQEATRMETASSQLNELLNTVGNQVSAALGQNSALTPLPISNWQAGIGDIPNLSASEYVPGPNDGAPIGWSVPPVRGFARLIDVCPTGTATIPMLPYQGEVLNAIQVTVQENPEMAQNIQSLETPSSYSIPENAGIRGLPGDYSTRMRVVGVLGQDLPAIAAYMGPVDSGLAAYNQEAQSVLGVVS
ncbi:MAG: hypothetical protein AB7T01_02210 [Acidithiobacillus sp.]